MSLLQTEERKECFDTRLYMHGDKCTVKEEYRGNATSWWYAKIVAVKIRGSIRPHGA